MAQATKTGVRRDSRQSTRKNRVRNVTSSPAPVPLAVRRHPLIPTIEAGLRRCGVPLDTTVHGREFRIIVGASGGADSVALLLGFWVISRRKSGARLMPIAVHIHHHLRDSADADAAWVKEFCDRLEIPFRLVHIEPAAAKGNVYANARRMRYAALQETAKREGAACIAVAHHADDQLETMIAALCRGAGLDGLTGMPWRRSLTPRATRQGEGRDRVMLIRPLLSATHSDCESLCRAAKAEWRDDPSNRDATRMRARLRRDVLPVLEQRWPDAARRASTAADAVREARQIVRRAVKRNFGNREQREWDRSAMRRLPVSIIATGLRRAALAHAPHIADQLSQRHLVTAAQVIRSDDRKPHHFDWPAGLRLSVTSKRVSLAAVIEKTKRKKGDKRE